MAKKKPYHQRRHTGIRTTEAMQDIGTTLQLVQSGFINDDEFYELFNWERTKLGFKPWTKDQFNKAIIEPARKKALENRQKAAEQAVVDAKRKFEMDAQQERQIKIKELEQLKRIKELQGEVIQKDITLHMLRKEFSIGQIEVELDEYGKRKK